jgi:hypothetical protein
MHGLAVHGKSFRRRTDGEILLLNSAPDFAFNLSVGLVHTILGGKTNQK